MKCCRSMCNAPRDLLRSWIEVRRGIRIQLRPRTDAAVIHLTSFLAGLEYIVGVVIGVIIFVLLIRLALLKVSV